MITIQKGLTMPDKPAPTQRVNTPKYPWLGMGVTDSFFVQGKREGKTKRYLSTLVSKAEKKYKKKFLVQEVPTGFNVFCTATNIGTPEAKQWDFDAKKIVPGPFEVPDTKKPADPANEPPADPGGNEPPQE